MRRILLASLMMSLLLLFGCSSGGKTLQAQDIDFTFSCKIDVTCPTGNPICSFNRAGQKNASIEVLSGSGKGLKWYWSGDGFTQTYYNLSAKSDNCVLPEGSFASLLVKMLDCAEKPGTLESTGNNVFSGSLNGCNFTLTADGNTGNIQTLSVPDWNVTVKFHDFEGESLETCVPNSLF